MPVSDNKLKRAQVRATKSIFVGEKMPTVDEYLVRLEEDIRRLKIEFDVFFNGAAKRPPYDTKSRVETLIKRLGDDRTLSYAQRYRFNSLAARYNAFRDLWRRIMQGREEGRDPGATARANAKSEAVENFKSARFICDDATRDVATVKEIYTALVEAKKACGEPVEDFSFPRFHRLIASKAESLKERLGCESVCFSVDVEKGHVSFRAKAEKD